MLHASWMPAWRLTVGVWEPTWKRQMRSKSRRMLTANIDELSTSGTSGLSSARVAAATLVSIAERERADPDVSQASGADVNGDKRLRKGRRAREKGDAHDQPEDRLKQDGCVRQP